MTVKGNVGVADTGPVIGQALAWLTAGPTRASSRGAAHFVAKLLAVAAAYFAAAKAGLALADDNPSVTAVWPPTGIALAALLLWGRGMWPGVALGALCANAWTGVPTITVLGIAVGNTLEALVGAILLVRVARIRPSLDRTHDVLALAAAVTLSTLVSATLGVASLRAGNAVGADALLSTWRTWWLGDLAGGLLVAPFLLVFARGAARGLWRGRMLEGTALLLTLTTVSSLVFSDAADGTFLIFPVLAWAALRFRQPGVTAGGLIVAGIAVGYTTHGMGPFAGSSEDQGLLLSQAFVGVSALVSLLLAGITAERERAETILRHAAEARFRDAFEVAPIGMAVVSPEGRFEKVNPALCEITGLERETLEAGGLDSIIEADELPDTRRQLARLLAGEMRSYETDTRCRHASGETVWLTLQATVVHDAGGGPAHVLAQMLDITDRRRQEEKLRYIADHDQLTGLLNRRSFERDLTTHLERGRRYGLEGAALMVDLDCFKQVNDSWGHHAGDELLVRVARALQGRLRESDVLARVSGDEFVALLPKVDRAGAREVAGVLLRAVRAVQLPLRGGDSCSTTASVGVAMIEDAAGLSGKDVMVNADLAMYAAKEHGGDRWAFYRSDAADPSDLLEQASGAEPTLHGDRGSKRLTRESNPLSLSG